MRSCNQIIVAIRLALVLFLSSRRGVHGLTIVITGTSQGIGLDASRRLLRKGHTVIHACNSMERAQVAVKEAGGGIPMVCDLSNLDSVRSFADMLRKKDHDTLDVLCLNAGIASSTKTETPNLSKQGLEECIAVNHLGHFLLANLLVDKLKESSMGGRLVVTASSVHDPEGPGGSAGGDDNGATLGDLSGFGIALRNNNKEMDDSSVLLPTMMDGSVVYSGSKVYKDSKLCNVLFCQEAFRRWGKDVSIRSFNPGFIPTSGLFRAPRQDNFFGCATAFTFVAGLIGFAVPVEIGGARLAYMALAPDEEVPHGSYYSAATKSRAITLDEGFDSATISKEAADTALAERLWTKSIEVVGL